MKNTDMGKSKISSLIISMALPPMISMLIQSLYNIVDSMFVSRISEDAFGAVSIIFPVQNLLLSVAVGLGVGLASYISRNLGAGEVRKANEACTIGVLMSITHYTLILLAGIFLLKPFIGLYTKSEETARLCYQYGMIIVVCSFGQNLHITLEKIFQSTGKMLISMSLQAAGCIANIILDPILIFGLGPIPSLGVAGAAIATVIGQMISFIGAAILFARGKSGLKIGKIRRDDNPLKTVASIYSVGLPSMLVMALPSILISGINSILKNISDMGVVLFGMYYKLQTFVYMPTSGLVQGIRPVIGYNYGANNVKREKSAFKSAMLVACSVMLAGLILFEALPDVFLTIFNASAALKEEGRIMLRIISICFIPSAVGMIIAAEFEAVGKGLCSLIITLLRQLLITLPFAYIMSSHIGITGVWIAFPVAEICAMIVAILMIRKEFKKR